MADNKFNDAHANVETTDRGMFDFMKKKEDSEGYKTPEEAEVVTSGVEKMHLSESQCKEQEKKHGGLLEKLHRSDSSSSSSDEEGDDEDKKKKRKEKKEKKAGLKEKIEEKVGGHKEEHDYKHGDTNVPIEKVHVQENVYSEPSYPAHQEGEEKKGGFLDKIKDKLPGKTKADEHEVPAPAPAPAPAPVPVSEPCVEGEEKEKKGFLDKIKDKIPGFHRKSDAHEEKEDHD